MTATSADPTGSIPVVTYSPTGTPAGTTTDGAPGSRRLAGRLKRVRATNLDLRNTWQIIAGALFLPLGVAVILLGWSGAAHGRVEQQQFPYLISGGLLGLALVLVGCFFYWAHWLYRIYDQADLHHQEVMREQRETIRALLEAMAPAGAGAAAPPVAEPVPAVAAKGGRSRAEGDGQELPVSLNGTSRTWVATPTGTNFHVPGCPMVANRSGKLRTISEKQAGLMKPCRVCEPLVHAN